MTPHYRAREGLTAHQQALPMAQSESPQTSNKKRAAEATRFSANRFTRSHSVIPFVRRGDIELVLFAVALDRCIEDKTTR